jgi:hypothetical protein
MPEMQFSRAIRFEGNVPKAFETATSVLIANDFRLISKTAHELEFAGPGTMNKRQPPIAGISRIRIQGGRGELGIDAELGGVRRLGYFLVFFPLAMACFFLVLFGFLFSEQGLPMILLFSCGPLLPWLVLSPLLIRLSKARVKQALENLLANMEIAGRSD